MKNRVGPRALRALTHASSLSDVKARLEDIAEVLRPRADVALALGERGAPGVSAKGLPRGVVDLAASFDGAVFHWSADRAGSGYLRLASLAELFEEGPFALHERGRGFRLVRGESFSMCVFEKTGVVEIYDEERKLLRRTATVDLLTVLNLGCDRLFVHGWEHAVFDSEQPTDVVALRECERAAKALWAETTHGRAPPALSETCAR